VHDELFDKTGDDSVLLRVHVLPGAGRTAVVGTHGDALKVRVAAPPTGGRANAACAELVCEVFGVKAAQVELKGGESSRSKRFAITGVDPADVSRLLDEAITTANAAPGRPRR
jgi:uncharacterized protein (TIGR00251 family)